MTPREAGILYPSPSLGRPPNARSNSSSLTASSPPSRYLDDEQLQAANDVLVDYLHQLQLAAHWGTGAFSSSDGQRSPARGRAATADAMAREFGFRRGALNLVNWVSDQYSQYGTKVVSVAETRSDPHA